MKCLAILGASGHGKVVAEAAVASGWQFIEFYDDAWPQKTRIGRWRIHGNQVALLQGLHRLDGVIVAIGHNDVRQSQLAQLTAVGAKLVSVVHPAAIVSDSAQLGLGCAVMAAVVINADAKIGAGAILNTGCTVDHDCELGMTVHISPGGHLAGNVRVGDRSWVGIGASVRQGITIGADVIVGAGAAVVSDVADGLTVVGVPARPLKAL